jgi:hypothetical protein
MSTPVTRLFDFFKALNLLEHLFYPNFISVSWESHHFTRMNHLQTFSDQFFIYLEYIEYMLRTEH